MISLYQMSFPGEEVDSFTTIKPASQHNLDRSIYDQLNLCLISVADRYHVQRQKKAIALHLQRPKLPIEDIHVRNSLRRARRRCRDRTLRRVLRFSKGRVSPPGPFWILVSSRFAPLWNGKPNSSPSVDYVRGVGRLAQQMPISKWRRSMMRLIPKNGRHNFLTGAMGNNNEIISRNFRYLTHLDKIIHNRSVIYTDISDQKSTVQDSHSTGDLDYASITIILIGIST